MEVKGYWPSQITPLTVLVRYFDSLKIGLFLEVEVQKRTSRRLRFVRQLRQLRLVHSSDKYITLVTKIIILRYKIHLRYCSIIIAADIAA